MGCKSYFINAFYSTLRKLKEITQRENKQGEYKAPLSPNYLISEQSYLSWIYICEATTLIKDIFF